MESVDLIAGTSIGAIIGMLLVRLLPVFFGRFRPFLDRFCV